MLGQSQWVETIVAQDTLLGYDNAVKWRLLLEIVFLPIVELTKVVRKVCRYV